MAILHYTEATGGLPNSGRLSGTDGDLVGILDVALVANGWAIEFSTGNARIYRPGSGNRFRLYVNDAAAVSGDARLSLIRGCENASAASNAGLTDPFPTAAKIADGSSNWLKSSVASTTGRAFDIYVAPTWLMYFCNVTGATNVWEMGLFGDWSPTLSGDSYCTACAVRSTTNATQPTIGGGVWAGVVGNNVATTGYNFARSYDGTVKSTSGGVVTAAGSVPFGTTGNTPAQGGPSTGIDMEKMVSLDSGTTTTAMSTSLSLQRRAFIPNLWLPQHSGRNTINTRDTFTNTAYNAAATFKVFCIANAVSSGFVIVEETDTWNPPSG